MPSSTSNSKSRAPGGPWLRTWVFALVFLALALAGWKAYWSSQGFGVALPDNPRGWVAARTKLQPKSTVLLGSSRIQAAIVAEEWAKEMDGERPLHLSLVGTSPLPILAHLADDTDFRGLAVIGVTEMFMFDAESTNDRAARSLADYRNLTTSPSRRSEVVLSGFVPNKVLVRHRRLNSLHVLEALWDRTAPRNPPNNMQTDRWIAFAADRVYPHDLEYETFEKAGRPATVAERDSIIAGVERCVETIQSRGGTVVLVAMPACATRRQIENRRYPRAMFWDALAAGTPAVAINAYDFPRLLEFRCSDGSHLDASDARRFTRDLARLIKDRI